MNKLVVAAGIVAGFAFWTPAMAQTKLTIPIIVKDTTSVYWQIVLAGARKAGRDLDVDVAELGARSEFDAMGQISILAKAVTSNPAAIVIAPAQFAAVGKAIDAAARSIKIIGIDSHADTMALTSFVGTDDVQAGRLAADALADAITKTYGDTEGNVTVITALAGSGTPNQSGRGFKEQVGKKYRALNLLPEQAADPEVETGFSIMKGLAAGDPDLRGVFASNAIMGKGASQVVYNKSGDRINFVVFGADDKLLKSLQDGTIAALLVQDPFRMGYEGIKTALAASKGEKVPANLDTGVTLITKANMSSARSQELLRPKIN